MIYVYTLNSQTNICRVFFRPAPPQELPERPTPRTSRKFKRDTTHICCIHYSPSPSGAPSGAGEYTLVWRARWDLHAKFSCVARGEKNWLLSQSHLIRGCIPTILSVMHKEEGMVIVTIPLCEAESCLKRPSFNTPGIKKGRYCASGHGQCDGPVLWGWGLSEASKFQHSREEERSIKKLLVQL